MKSIIAYTGIFLLIPALHAQDNKARFDSLLAAKDTTAQLAYLEQWEKEEPTDPELFTSYYNYLIARSRKEYLDLSTESSKGEHLILMDKDGKPTGYLGAVVRYDPLIMSEAFKKIDQGIALHPDRLDMRFGKAYMLAEMEDWKGFTNELVVAIDRSAENGNAWLWTRNEARDGGSRMFLADIQAYQRQLYETGVDSLLSNMRIIADKVLQHYPDHAESLSNLAVAYLLEGQIPVAIEALAKAHQLAPDDGIILGNLARAHYLNGDREKAVGMYELMLGMDDPEMREFARQQIEAMQGK